MDDQWASIPEPIGLSMASYQGLYVKFVSMMSPKLSVVKDNGEFDVDGALRTLSATAPIYSGIRTVFAFHALVYR